MNPFDPDAIAEAMHVGLTMSLAERKERQAALKAKVFRTTAEVFCRRFITALWSDDGEHVAALVHNEYHAEHFAGRCTFKEDLACWYNTSASFGESQVVKGSSTA